MSQSRAAGRWREKRELTGGPIEEIKKNKKKHNSWMGGSQMDRANLKCGVIRVSGGIRVALQKQYLSFGKPLRCDPGVDAILSGCLCGICDVHNLQRAWVTERLQVESDTGTV